jgi:hypothetical protein
MNRVVMVVAFALATASAQTPGGKTNEQPGDSTNVPSQNGAIRVNSPTANEKVGHDFVRVTYQLLNRGVAAAPSPTFNVQLDGQDPVSTSSYDYTFTGLTPGPHTVTVTLVDANGVPIANSSVAVKFVVVQSTTGAWMHWQEPRRPVQLAEAEATPLPMLSMVGFAVLLGGICTAVRSRP